MTDDRIEALERENAGLRERLARCERAADGGRSSPVDRLLGDRVLLESLPEVVAVLDRDMTLLYLNRTIRGRTTAEMIGGNAQQWILPEHFAGYREMFERAWSSGEPCSTEFSTLSDYWWQTRFVPVKDAGEVVLMLVTSLDATERVRAERALRASESRLRHAVDVVGMGTWTHDWRSDRIVWDHALCEIFGVSQYDVPTSYEAYLKHLHPEDRERVHASFVRARRSGEFAEIEHRILRASGEVRHVLAKGSSLYDAHGEAIGSLGAVFDVTARKQLEEQLYQSQKLEAVGQLTAGIAHNFNNLLSIILPNVELCMEEASERLVDRLADIEHAAVRAADLIKQLMLFARRDAEVVKIALDPVALLRRTVEICRTTFDRAIRIDFDAGPDVPRVRAHIGQLEQVLLNICINARDAFEDGRTQDPQLTIEIARGSGDVVCIRVRDNGPGMDAATRARIFEPFFTTKEVGRGTGLGLATAYAIIADHGGRLECETRPGAGTCFEIVLPAVSAELQPMAARRESRPPRGTETVFIVDDEPLVRRATRSMLERGGYQVFEAGDGREALALFAARRAEIQLIILDRSMPGMSGDRVFAELEALGCSAPIVLLSGQVTPGASAERAAAVLSKPIDASALLEAVRNVLDHSV
ncbi:MAG TPA: PAS domain-containing protein [Polyangiales bacterium]|nr:PAS domain-containing protein [Polyangiales bacterium]